MAVPLTSCVVALAQPPGNQPAAPPSSYAPVVINEPFATVLARMSGAKTAVNKRQADLLAQRYDLSNQPAAGVTMSRGKAMQGGVRHLA